MAAEADLHSDLRDLALDIRRAAGTEEFSDGYTVLPRRLVREWAEKIEAASDESQRSSEEAS
jgi:hypothetical protein